MKKTSNIKSFEKFNKTLKNSTNERYFGGSDSDGEVNIKIDGEDEGTKKIIVKEIQILLNNFGGRINLYLDGEQIESRSSYFDHPRNTKNSTNERYFGSDSGTDFFKHKIEDLNIDSVLEGLDLLRRYKLNDYYTYFGDKIFKTH